jgi:manganese/zinc/iron transport system substrate-binding protein
MRTFRNLFLLLLPLLMVACGGPVAPTDNRLHVVATTGMIGDLALRVGGDSVRVEVLMGPGVDPHLYKASEGDLGRLQSADLILHNGLHLEGRMGDVLASLGPRAVAVGEGIPDSLLLVSETMKHAPDPHIWFDLQLWMHAAETVRAALEAKRPAAATLFKGNSERTRARLALLHSRILAAVETLPPDRRVLVSSHDAFRYFGRAYGVKVKGLQGISTASEAGTRDVQRLASSIVSAELPAIFVESSVPRRTMEAVLAAVKSQGHDCVLGGELYSDALGSPGTPEETFEGVVIHNVRTLVTALGGDASVLELPLE